MPTRAIRGGCVLVVAALVVAGCGDVPRVDSPRPDPGDKAGGQSGPIAINVVDAQPQGKPSNLPLGEFASQVASRSGESMTVTVDTDTPDDAIPARSDAEVIAGVRGGTFEMAVVPARAWSDAGVSSLRALQAPFLVESDDQAAAIVRDAAFSARAFQGLDGSGVTGLVLYPEGLRHLFGFGAPILTPADLADRQIRAQRSGDTDAIFEALGGVPIRAEGDALKNGITAGTIRGLESSFALMSDEHWQPIATGNVVPYAKVGTLVVNTPFWTGLTDAQRTIVTEAAIATREWAISHLELEADAAARYCRSGGSVVLADPASVDQFRAAADDVTRNLAKDASTNALMTMMRDAAQGHSPPAVKECQQPLSMPIEADGGDLPDGIYRVDYTEEFLKSRGVTNYDYNRGVWTYRLDDGHWTIDQRADNALKDHDTGLYQVKGSELYWRWDNDPGWPIDHLTWTVAPNGDLVFVAAPENPDAWPFDLRFIRVGALTD